MSLKQTDQLDQQLLAPLRDRTVAVIGYGNQGRSHALNLRDSGVRVLVGSRADSRGMINARADGFDPSSIDAAVTASDLVIIALPDEVQPDLWRREIAPHLRPDAIVGFLHGFSIHYELIRPEADRGIIMIAPKGPGETLRQRYLEGRGMIGLLAVHQDTTRCDALDVARAWAEGIGCGRAGIITTTFAQETQTDLFGEQAVLCGGLTWLILAAFEALVEAGYDPRSAYIECCHEVKQIADLIHTRGITGMMEAISTTAEFGACVAGASMVNDEVRASMKVLLRDIRSGSFAERLRNDYSQDFRWLNEQREFLKHHPIEPAGEAVRAMIPWLNEPKTTT